MSNNRLLELISRKLSGEATPEEIGEIEELLAVDVEAAERLQLLSQFWLEHNNASQQSTDEAFEKLKLKLHGHEEQTTALKGKNSGNLLWAWIAAASVVLIASSVVYLRKGSGYVKQKPAITKNEVAADKKFITLPDETKVWLKGDSKIDYPETFTGATREVLLEGEAFFDVTKNAAKPFIIHLTNGTLKVIGTSFNVRAYKHERTIEASVASGKVAFIPSHNKASGHDTVYLTREKKLRYSVINQRAVVESTVSKKDMAWISGKLIFKAMSLEDITIELEKTFGKTFIFESQSARQFQLTGSFQNNSLEEVLFYLSKTKDFNYTIEDHQVTISEGRTKD